MELDICISTSSSATAAAGARARSSQGQPSQRLEPPPDLCGPTTQRGAERKAGKSDLEASGLSRTSEGCCDEGGRKPADGGHPRVSEQAPPGGQRPRRTHAMTARTESTRRNLGPALPQLGSTHSPSPTPRHGARQLVSLLWLEGHSVKGVFPLFPPPSASQSHFPPLPAIQGLSLPLPASHSDKNTNTTPHTESICRSCLFLRNEIELNTFLCNADLSLTASEMPSTSWAGNVSREGHRVNV